MRMVKTGLLSLCVLSLVAACGTSGQLTVADGTGEDQLAPDAVDMLVEAVIPKADDLPEVWFPELVGHQDGLAADLTPNDLDGPQKGEAGWPCEDGDQCLEGFCILTADGKQCTRACEEECPFGWLCLQYTPSLPDQVFICAPTNLELCRPCYTNNDCLASGVDAGQKCVSYGGEGAFCGGTCTMDGEPCPPATSCQEVKDVTGATVTQCVADSGLCECSQLAIDAGAATPCLTENEWGTCAGERGCLAEGLTDCDAKVPEAEVCNGLDDDCDLDIDEGLDGADCLLTNQYGACPGIENCTDGVISCDGEEPMAELCDGKDNDCDGEVDEQFPDTDEDGVADCLETDKDGDAIPDGMDNCPAEFNPDQADFDLDSQGDVCDLDDDNDMVGDGTDCAPLDNEAYPGADEVCDGKDNDCNGLVDEGFADADFDGWKDCVDEDDDNDGSIDELDCEPLNGSVFPGAVEACNGLDDDCDQNVDEGFADMDEDEIADCVDGDADGDGIAETDNCPLVPNPDQEDKDGDGVGDACDGDADGDGIPDGVDNCPLVQNPQQKDLDEDGLGDECDQDKDGDGDPDDSDCAPLDSKTNSDAQELCDGADNDCNGEVDDGLGEFQCGKGQCDHLVPICMNGIAGVCDPYAGAAPETCDGIDNDCDGLLDEDQGTTSCGLGICAHFEPVCLDGAPNQCDPVAGAGEEVCDGLDNDCDGKTDEEQPALACGKGQCFHTQASCVGGIVFECDPFKGALPESCDGLDNDCDGESDEGLGETTCGLGQCDHTTANCKDGAIQICNPFVGAEAESCDELDNDCDGIVDEDMGFQFCGLGVCQTTVDACVDGVPGICDPFAGASIEICDELDNDCNGVVDDECVLVAGEVCAEDGECESGSCRVDWDGEGTYCAQTEITCIDVDEEVVNHAPDGWVECDDSGALYRVCESGIWTSEEGTSCGAAVCDGGCGYIAEDDNLCLSGDELGVTGGCEFEDLGGGDTTCEDCGHFTATAGACNSGLESCSVACGAECGLGELSDTGTTVCWADEEGDSWSVIDICGTDGVTCAFQDDAHESDELAGECGQLDCVDGACLEGCDGDDANCNAGAFCGPLDKCYGAGELAPWAMSGDYMVLTKTDATYFAGTDCPGNFFAVDETTVSDVPFRVGPYNPSGTMNGLTSNKVVPAPFDNWTVTNAHYIFPGGRCSAQPINVTFTYTDATTATTGTASIPHDCSSAGTWSGSNYTIKHIGTYGGPCCDHWYYGLFTNPNPAKAVASIKATYTDGCGGSYNGQLWAMSID